MRRLRRGATVAALLLPLAGCHAIHSLALPQLLSWPPRLHHEVVHTPAAETLVGAGDIGFCGLPGAALTAALLDQIPGTVFTAGDNAYPDGSDEDFASCYAPTWGRHRARTHPVPGNHEYRGDDGYWRYFGDAAGPPGRGYYSYTVAGWHVVALNSNVADGAMAAQLRWLRADLATHPVRCTVAYWHHALFVSAADSTPAVRPLWEALEQAHADVVIAGHVHLYERFAVQTAAGRRVRGRGLREFVVGTGGAGLDAFGARAPHSERRLATTYGVLRLRLMPGRYAWEFIDGAGKSRDHGEDGCR